MTNLFKKTWFRCIFVLSLLAIILAGILTVLNDVLYVSSEERTMRAIVKIYGKEVSYTIEYDADKEGKEIECADYGRISKIYYVGDNTSTEYEMLFQSTGINGFKGGEITCWTKIKVKDGKYDIDKVVLESFTKQTFMSKLGAEFYDGFKLTDVTEKYKAGLDFSAIDVKDKEEILNPVSGATKSATAGTNAVNCVLYYLGEKV